MARDPSAHPAHEPADAVAADDRTRPRRAHATRVAVEDHVVGEHVDQLVDVPVAGRSEETLGKPLALPPRRLEARLLGLDVAPRARRELPAVVLTLPDRLCDLAIAVAEHVVEQEHRTFDGRQLLEQHEERKREAVCFLGMCSRVVRYCARVREQRLGEPFADVDLAAGARRLQLVDRQPRDDRRQERRRRVDLGALPQGPLEAQERVLDESSASLTRPSIR